MIGEIDLYGVFVPSLLALMLIAFAVCGALRHALARLGLYRVVWHRSLFNFALYVIVLGAMITLTHR
jgi:hypothetical protein